MKSISVLIKPSSDQCNIACEYCFYHDVSKYRSGDSCHMTMDTLEKIVERVFEFAEDSASIAFQGGEPMLVGLDFYEKFMGILERYNTRKIEVALSLQTNGLLIDDQWAVFFSKNKFLIGLSLDGVKELHNRYRVDRQGRPTFDKVMSGIEALKFFNVDFNILQVITKNTIGYIDDNYEFYKANQLQYVQPIPVLDELFSDFGHNTYSLSAGDYATYLNRTFDLWYSDFIKGQGITITYFEQIITKIMGESNIACGINGQCMIQFVVEASGDVYPCDFYVTDEWKLGNIQGMTFESMMHKRRSHIFVNESFNLPEECSQCKWQPICEGGCKRHRQRKEGYSKNYFCDAYKAFYEHAYPVMLTTAVMISKHERK